MNNKDRISKIYNMISERKTQEAFEEFYHEDVCMIEPGGVRREGKQANRDAHQEWYASLDSVDGGGVSAITSDEANNVTMVETYSDFTFKGGHKVRMEQIARQKWQDGQIIEEKFYYDTKPFG